MVSSASRMDASSFSAARSAVKTYTSFFPGLTTLPLLSRSLLLGSYLLNVLLSPSWTRFLVLVTYLCTASLSATTPPPTPLAGRVFRWPWVSATFSGRFLSANRLTGSRSILTMFLALPMMWPMP